jgi:hypothetical protein
MVVGGIPEDMYYLDCTAVLVVENEEKAIITIPVFDFVITAASLMCLV